jgi:hypothetical protein
VKDDASGTGGGEAPGPATVSEAGSGVGWLRRDRTTDLGAVALVIAGSLAAGHVSAEKGGRLLGGLLALGGLALALFHRDRWLERADGKVWLVTARWWLRPWRTRRVRVRPNRVLIAPEGTGWRARRTVLSLESDDEGNSGLPPRVEVLEKWREPSCRVYAQSVAASLARWLGTSTGGVLAPFEPLNPGAARAGLRASLSVLTDRSSMRPRPPPARWQVAGHTHRIAARRRWFEILGSAWLVVLGAALALAWRVRTSAALSAVVFAAALPVGAALLIEGARSILAGRVITRVGPDALTIERAGLSRELRLHVLFSDLATVTLKKQKGSWRSSWMLELGLRDQRVEVRGYQLGLRPRDLPWFAEICGDAIGAWLDRFPGMPGPSDAPIKFLDQPTHRPERYRPASVLSVLGARWPRLATLTGVLLVLDIYPLQAVLARDLLPLPDFIRIGRFSSPGFELYTLLNLAAAITGGLVAATFEFTGLKMIRSAPRFRGRSAWVLVLLFPFIGTLAMVVTTPEAVDVVNICNGTARPPQLPVVVALDRRSLRYGPSEYRRPAPAKGGRQEEARFDSVVDHADALVEVKGLIGWNHLVVAKQYERICGLWRSRLRGDPPSTEPPQP